MILGTKETAYINAISSAALVQSIAKACRRSLEDCGCGPKRSSKTPLLPKPHNLDNVSGKNFAYNLGSFRFYSIINVGQSGRSKLPFVKHSI